MILITTHDVIEHFPKSTIGTEKVEDAKIGLAIQLLLKRKLAAKAPAGPVIAQLRHAAKLDQLEIFHDRFGGPKGFAVWARVSDADLEDLLCGKDLLADEANWSSGRNAWIVLFSAEKAAFKAAVRQMVERTRDAPSYGYIRLKQGKPVASRLSLNRNPLDTTRGWLAPAHLDQGAPYVFHAGWSSVVRGFEFAKAANQLAAARPDLSFGELGALLQPPNVLGQSAWIKSTSDEAKFIFWAWLDASRLSDRLDRPIPGTTLAEWNDGPVPCIIGSAPRLARSDIQAAAEAISDCAGRDIEADQIACHADCIPGATTWTWLSQLPLQFDGTADTQ